MVLIFSSMLVHRSTEMFFFWSQVKIEAGQGEAETAV